MLTGHLRSLDFSYLTVFPISLLFHRAMCFLCLCGCCAWCIAGLHGDLESSCNPSGVEWEHLQMVPYDHAAIVATYQPRSTLLSRNRIILVNLHASRLPGFSSGLLLCCRYRRADGADFAHGGGPRRAVGCFAMPVDFEMDQVELSPRRSRPERTSVQELLRGSMSKSTRSGFVQPEIAVGSYLPLVNP